MVAEPIRGIPVIIVPVGDDRAACHFAGQVQLGTQGPLGVQTLVSDAFILRKEITNLVRAVIDDDQFFIGIVLPEKIADRQRHEAAPVVRWHEAGNQRL